VLLCTRGKTNLVKLETHQAYDERRRCSNGRYDFTSNLLRGMAVSGIDAVVHRTKVGSGGDEVDMIVCVIVLLELDRVEAIANERGR
jgi:hypothetical protein